MLGSQFKMEEQAQYNQYSAQNSKVDVKLKPSVSITKTQQTKPSQKVLETSQGGRQSNSPTNFMHLSRGPKKVLVKQSALSSKPAQETTKIKNSHIVMNNQHVKIKATVPLA